MAYVVRLRIRTQPDFRCTVDLGPAGLLGASGTLGSDAVQELSDMISAPQALPVVVLPGGDAALRAREESIGTQLATLLLGDPTLALELGRCSGLAAERDTELVIAVDADGGSADWPWELLELGMVAPPFDGEGRIVVARLVHGPKAASEVAGPAQCLAWWPDVDDPAVAALAPNLVGLTMVAPENGRLCLIAVCHGTRVGELTVLTAPGERSVGSVVDRLMEQVADVDLAICAICETADLDVLHPLPARFVRAGATSCIAPHGELGLEAAVAWVGALRTAIESGQSTPRAVWEGRKAVRALALPTADARAHEMWWTLADLGAYEGENTPIRIDKSWPTPGPNVAPWLAEAIRLSEARREGFVGLEHLILASDAAPAEVGNFAYQLGTLRRTVDERLTCLQPAGDVPETPRPSPRMGALMAHLTPGFDAMAFKSVLTSHASLALVALGGSRARLAVPTDSVTIRDAPGAPVTEPAPATVLEVLGGPEDGRTLTPEAGQTIGRAGTSRTSDLTLYDSTFLADWALSRAHLTWLGPGRIRARAPVTHWAAGAHSPREVSGDLTLSCGDLLGLGAATQLFARRA